MITFYWFSFALYASCFLLFLLFILLLLVYVLIIARACFSLICWIIKWTLSVCGKGLIVSMINWNLFGTVNAFWLALLLLTVVNILDWKWVFFNHRYFKRCLCIYEIINLQCSFYLSILQIETIPSGNLPPGFWSKYLLQYVSVCLDLFLPFTFLFWL